MKQITKHENLNPALNDREKAVVIASKSKSLFMMGSREIAKEILHTFRELYVITGQKVPQESDLVAMLSLLADKLKKTFPNVRISEVILAMKSGAFGDYGEEVVYISAKSVVGWVEAYQHSKHETLKKQLDFEAEEKKKAEEVKKKEEQREYFKSFPDKIEKVFEAYLMKGELPELAWLYYQVLDECEVVDISNERKKELYQIALDNENKRRKDLNPFQRRALKYEPQKTFEELIKQQARKLALKDCFDEWKEINWAFVRDNIEEGIEANIEQLIETDF